MTRETRYNVIFIVALLAVSLPGITMLVRKKLSQPARESRGALAAPVRKAVIFVDPIPQTPGLSLVYPPQTRDWSAAQGSFATPPAEPLTSRNRSFQVVGGRPRDTDAAAATSLTLLVWDPRCPTDDPAALAFAVTGGPGADRPVPVTDWQLIDVPPDVLGELRQSGYMTPPARIARATLDLPADAGRDALLAMTARTPNGTLTDAIELWQVGPPAGR